MTLIGVHPPMQLIHPNHLLCILCPVYTVYVYVCMQVHVHVFVGSWEDLFPEVYVPILAINCSPDEPQIGGKVNIK